VLTAALIAQIILLLAGPIGVTLWLRQKLKVSWMLFLGGALAFSASWIITAFLPLPAELGLLVSSIVQMSALYLVYRFMLSTVQTEREGLMVGLGHGGIELLVLVVFVVIPTFAQMSQLRTADDQTLTRLAAQSQGVAEEEIQPSDIDELRESIDDYWSRAWYEPVIQTIPPLTGLPIQMALAVIVLSAITGGTFQPLIGAIALHFLSKSLPLFAGLAGGVLAWIALSLVFAGVAIWYLRRLWPTVQAQAEAEVKRARKAAKRASRAK
jgi:uncharacterized membrane protein YhfC